MSERIPRPTDALKVGFRTDPASPNAITEIPVAKREDGHAYKEKVPHDELNWSANLWGALLLWLMSYVPREWTTLREGIQETTTPGRFVVVPNTGATLKRQNPIFTAATNLGYPPLWAVTDGRAIYYIDSNSAAEGQNVIAVHPETGAVLWNQAKGATAISGLACDGTRVFTTEYGLAGVDKRDINTGAINSNGGTTPALRNLACNGDYLVGVAGNTLAFFDNLQATPNETGTVTVGADTFQAAAVDADNVYCGGAFVSNPFRCYNLFNRLAQWTVSPPTIAVPDVLAVVTDGDVVFFGTTREELTGGGVWANLWAVNRATGAMLGSWDVGSNSDWVRHLAIDDKYLYATSENSSGGLHREVHVYDRYLQGAIPHPQADPLWLVTGGDAQAWDADGIAAVIGVGTQLTPGALIRRSHYHIKAREFQRVTDDPGRQPWAKAAIPK